MGSKFKGLLDAARERTPEDGSAPAPSGEAPAASSPPADASTTAPRPLGRPRGKRSDPEYEQITAYVRKETYRALKIKLLTSGDERDASEVIEDLIGAWLGI